MNTATDDVLRGVLHLPARVRAALVEGLLSSLNHPDLDMDKLRVGRYREAVREALTRIELFREAYAPLGERTRRCLVNRFPDATTHPFGVAFTGDDHMDSHENPSLRGQAQTDASFGEINVVRDRLGIETKLARKLPEQHLKYPRFWG